MVTVIRQTQPKARKEYFCDLAEYVGEINWPEGMTFSELRALSIYEKKGRKILKGEKYVCQFNKHDGLVYQFKMSMEIFLLFCKYDLFPEL